LDVTTVDTSEESGRNQAWSISCANSDRLQQQGNHKKEAQETAAAAAARPQLKECVPQCGLLQGPFNMLLLLLLLLHSMA
jgi:hypothetical protein